MTILPAVLRSIKTRVLAIFIALLTSASHPLANGQVLQWEVTGQVLELFDPDTSYFGPNGLLGDVRVGDPVRGIVYYDLQLPPDPEDEPYEGTYYFSETSIPGPVYTVENPRDQTELTFSVSAEEAEYLYYDALIFNDLFDEDLGETIDEFFLEYEVDLFEQLPGLFQMVSYYFGGQNPIDDEMLPTELTRDSWPIGEIVFADADYDPDIDNLFLLGGIFAEIYTIEPIETVALPGDFNADGLANGTDFLVWQRGESTNPLSTADLNDWKANYGGATTTTGISTGVPEPATWQMMIIMIGIAVLLSPVDLTKFPPDAEQNLPETKSCEVV